MGVYLLLRWIRVGKVNKKQKKLLGNTTEYESIGLGTEYGKL